MTTPVPLGEVVGRIDFEPSPLPSLVESAAWTACANAAIAHSDRPDHSRDVFILTSRDRNEGWSTRLSWPRPLHGVPPFDGELVLQDADADQTWIGLEGAITLFVAESRSERALRSAQVRIRSMLVHLSDAVGPGE